MVTSCARISRINKVLEKVTVCRLTRTECAIYLAEPWKGGFPASPRARLTVTSLRAAESRSQRTPCASSGEGNFLRVNKPNRQSTRKSYLCQLTRTECAIYLALPPKKLPSAARGGGWKASVPWANAAPPAPSKQAPVRPHHLCALCVRPTAPSKQAPHALPPPLRPLREAPVRPQAGVTRIRGNPSASGVILQT